MDWWLPGAGGEEEWGLTANGYWVSFRGDVNVLKLDSGDVNMLKTVELYTLKWRLFCCVNYISVKSAVTPIPLPGLYLGSNSWLLVALVVDGFHQK